MELISVFLLTILMMLFFSALVSGSEAALLSISYPKVKELSNSKNSSVAKKGKYLLKIKENMQPYITTIVVLNNITNIVGSIYVGVLTSLLFGEFYLGIVSGILTFLIILFAEIIPKIYGEQYCDEISIIIAGPLLLITKLLTPIIWILNKLIGLFVKNKLANLVSEEEIKEMVALGKKEGSIESFESEVIENIFKINDTEAYDIMVPKNKVVYFTKNASFEEIVNKIEDSGFSRFPVIKDGDVLGIINAKDLFKYYSNTKEFEISKILRPIVFAPETMKLSTLEKKLKKLRIHLAAIVNEHGDFTGIITLEDIIEEIIGDIVDEHDLISEKKIEEISKGKYHIRTSIEILELNSSLNLDLPQGESYSTLNGYLIYELDSIPRINDTFEVKEGIFRVIKRSKKKILEVEFLKKIVE